MTLDTYTTVDTVNSAAVCIYIHTSYLSLMGPCQSIHTIWYESELTADLPSSSPMERLKLLRTDKAHQVRLHM